MRSRSSVSSRTSRAFLLGGDRFEAASLARDYLTLSDSRLMLEESEILTRSNRKRTYCAIWSRYAFVRPGRDQRHLPLKFW